MNKFDKLILSVHKSKSFNLLVVFILLFAFPVIVLTIKSNIHVFNGSAVDAVGTPCTGCTPPGPYTISGSSGRIEAENFNLNGYNDTTPTNIGNSSYRTGSVDIEKFSTESTPSIGYFMATEWMDYNVNVTQSGTYSLTARVSYRNVSGGTFHVSIGGNTINFLITSAGDWSVFHNISPTSPSQFHLDAGVYTLRIQGDSNSSNTSVSPISVGNLNWVHFNLIAADPAPTPTPRPTSTPVPPGPTPTPTPRPTPTSPPPQCYAGGCCGSGTVCGNCSSVGQTCKTFSPGDPGWSSSCASSAIDPSSYCVNPPPPPPAGACWAGCMEGDIPTIRCIICVLQNSINFLTGAAAIVALFIIVYAGVTFVTSNGDKEKVEIAKKTLTYGIIGLILISTVFVIMKIIADISGVQSIL